MNNKRRMPGNSFKKKYGLKTLSLCLLIGGITILIAHRLQVNAAKEIIREVNKSQLMIIQEIASDLDSLVKDVLNKTVTWVALHPLYQKTPSEIHHELQIFFKLMEDRILRIGIVNQEGGYEYFFPPLSQEDMSREKDFSKTDFFQNALKQAKSYSYSKPHIGNQVEGGFGMGAIPISLPLFNQDNQNNKNEKEKVLQKKDFLGILFVFLDLSIIDDICQNHYSHLHDYSTFWLIDEQGNFLSHENKSWIGKNSLDLYKRKGPEGHPPSIDWVVQQKMLKGNTGTEVVIDRAEKHYLNYTPVLSGAKNWSIAVSTPEAMMDHWEKRVLKSAWQWWLFMISFLLVCLSFVQVVVILIHKKRINWEKEQREKFQTAFDGITDLVYLIDIDHNLRIVNKAFKKLCGKLDEEFEGEKCFRFIQGRQEPCPDCPIPKTRSTHKTQQLDQPIFQQTAHLYAYPLMNEEGETTAIVIFARITTKEKILEQKLQHRERLSLLGELAACLVHEIKNPLMGIGMLAQVSHDSCMEDNPKEDDLLKEDLERIVKECKRLENLINNLARFSSPAPVCFDKGDIHKSLDFSLALLREKLKNQNIQLQTNYQKDLPSITYDSQKMQQVFLNVIINAIKAMPKGGKLDIRSRLDQNSSVKGLSHSHSQMVCIEIEDTGIGISEEVRKEIFKPFFSNSLKGTGLGLSIVHSIIQQHGGKIHLKSRLGQGTVFTICLPVEQQETNHFLPNSKTNG